MRTMTPGERFMRCLNFESVDRIPVMDFGYWRETIDAWHKQGLPAEVDSTEEVERYFGCDRGFETNLVNYWGDNGPVGIEWRAWPRELLGPENLLISYYDDPDLIHAIQRNHTDFVKDWVDMVWEVTPLDYVCFFEDMAYNHGCFISPKTFDEFLMPYYHELVAYLRAKGVKKVLVDSDGNSVQLTDKLVEAGADGHYPLEINSGAFPEEIRKRHPKLALIGGINKLALAQDRAAIDKELSKLPPLLEQGGYIPSLDHRVQPDVPMVNYHYYIEKKREIMEKYCY